MVEPSLRRIVVAGSTGLVGKELTTLLAERTDVHVTALVRKLAAGRFPPSVRELEFDFDRAASYAALADEGPDVIFCCLGTTRKKAGSDEAFQKVDRDYPLALLAALETRSPRPIFALVSSVGADSPRGLYLRTKAEVEERVMASGLPYVIVRPSLLLGERTEERLAEKVSAVTIGPMLSGLGKAFRGLKRYSPISGREVARALIHLALEREPGPHIAEGELLFAAATR